MIDVYARFQDQDTTAPIFFEDVKVGKKMKEKCSVFFKKVCRSSTVFNRELVL